MSGPGLRGAWVGALVALAVLIGIGMAGGPLPRAAAQTLLPPLVTPESAAAVERGLEYLRRTQRADGSWGATAYGQSYPMVMTSLPGLAFLAHGDTPFRGKYAAEVKKAVDYVLINAENRIKQDANATEALIAGSARSMYGHGFGMLFLAQAYGMCDESVYQDRIRRVLEKAIALTARSQSKLGGWLYTPDSNGDEGSVTVTQVQALRACRNAGIKVPKTTIDRAVKYIEGSAQPDGGIAYRSGMTGSRPPITAAAVAVLYSAGRYDSPYAAKGLAYAVKNVTVDGSQVSGHYFYSHLYMAQATYTAGGKYWEDYFPKMRDKLVGMQNKGDGSWQGDSVGTTYGTAIACLILQLPYNTLPIMQR
jgi:hypothetical protein